MTLDGLDTVIVHEAVRPLVSTAEFRALIDAQDRDVMYRHTDPVHGVRGPEYVEDLLDETARQRPAAPKFHRAELAAPATRRHGGRRTFTEDASLFFKYAPNPSGSCPAATTT